MGRMIRSSTVLLLITGIGFLSTSSYATRPFVDLGPTPELAFDQPFVNFQIGNGKSSFGPASGTFLLDTGANGILVVGNAASELWGSGGNFQTGEFLEIGVGGFVAYEVSNPYEVTINSLNDTANSITLNDVRVMSDPFSDFGFGVPFQGIVGMPAMVDRVTTIGLSGRGGIFGKEIDIFDLDALLDLLLGGLAASSMDVSFSNVLPPSSGHRYGVQVRPLHFDPAQNNPNGPHPSYAPLPALTVTHVLGDKTSTGDNYVLDTGAQFSIMSLSKIKELGLAPATDAFTTLPISGVGGITTVPVFLIDQFRITTEDGVDLVWDDEDPDFAGLQVIGLDLDPSIDGVIGSDLLTSGLLDIDFFTLEIESGNGPFQNVHFDFRRLDSPLQDGTGTIYFDLNPTIDQLIIPGDADKDGDVDFTDFNQLTNHFNATNATWSIGDFDQDGDVDFYDFNTLSTNFGFSRTNQIAAVPEPSALIVSLVAIICLLSRVPFSQAVLV